MAISNGVGLGVVFQQIEIQHQYRGIGCEGKKMRERTGRKARETGTSGEKNCAN